MGLGGPAVVIVVYLRVTCISGRCLWKSPPRLEVRSATVHNDEEETEVS